MTTAKKKTSKTSSRKTKSNTRAQKKPSQELISVIITIFNEEHVVGKAIASMLKQSYKKFELVLVDNGSTDNTVKVLNTWAKKDKRIRITKLKKNLGPGGGRNAGAKDAKGSILIFVDADMVFDKRYVEILTKPIREGKTIGTVHTRELVANPENLWARSWSINRIPDGDNMQGGGVFRAIKKNAFVKGGGFDSSKGYFDDDLSHVATATPVPATCYHNNPEKLSEVYHHSTWVGDSLISTPENKHKYAGAIYACLFALLFLGILAFSHAWMLCAILVALPILAFLAFTLKRALPRIIDEKRPEYLFSIPFLWAVRMIGYLVGAAKQLFRFEFGGARLLIIFILAGVLIRLGLIFWSQDYVQGMWDITSLRVYANEMIGGLNPYMPNAWPIVYPPVQYLVMGALGYFFGGTAAVILPFKVMLMFVDVGIMLLLYNITFREGWAKKKSLLLVGVYAIHPLALMINTIHGQTDVVVAFFILLSLYLLKYHKKEALAALVLGIGIATKQYAAFLLPLLLFSPAIVKKLRFFIIASIPTGLLFLLFLTTETFHTMLRTVVGYAPPFGSWGLSLILTKFIPAESIQPLFAEWKYVLIGAVVLVGWLLRKRNIFVGAFGILLTLLVFAQGFGIQYYYWLLPFSLLFFNGPALTYSALATGGAVMDYAGNFVKVFTIPFLPFLTSGFLLGLSDAIRILIWFFLLWWLCITIKKGGLTKKLSTKKQ